MLRLTLAPLNPTVGDLDGKLARMRGAAEALATGHGVGLCLPAQWSSPGSVEDSATLCSHLGVRLFEHPLQDRVDTCHPQFAAAFGTPLSGLALENVRARLLGALLMEFSNAFGHTNGGLDLIGDLDKTRVFALCRHLNASAGRELIPAAILDQAPSAKLAPGQRNTGRLPLYPVLDGVLKRLIEAPRLAHDEAENARKAFARLTDHPGGARAFGSGRQMPNAAHDDV